jgi:hypothetical protein
MFCLQGWKLQHLPVYVCVFNRNISCELQGIKLQEFYIT